MEDQAGSSTIAMELSTDDAVAFSQLDFAKKRHRYNRFYQIQLIAVLLSGILLYVFFNEDAEDLRNFKNVRDFLFVLLATALIIGASFALEVVPGLREKFLKKESRLKEDYSGLWRFTVKSEGLHVSYSSCDKLIPWQQIEQVEADDNYLYLKIDNAGHLLMPKTKVISGDYEMFTRTLLQKIK